MGYRSTVAYTIRCESDDDTLNRHTFFTFIAEAKANDSCRAALEECEVDEMDLRINYHVEDVKWYDSYPHVENHMKLIELASDTIDTYEDTKECLGYVFARIGDNDDDTEWRAKGAYNTNWLWIKRSLIMDW